jgi:hypothetical protein
MIQLFKFIAGFLLCLLVFSLTTSLSVNIIAFNRISVGGKYDAFYLFIMSSPTIFGYYCIHYFVQYTKQNWDKRPIYIWRYISIAIGYTYVLGYIIPIISITTIGNNQIYDFIGISLASSVTYWVLRDSFEK